MHTDSNRLLLELEKVRRDINREVINPAIKELSLDSLQPILKMVARARASYVQALFEIAGDEGLDPSQEQIADLKRRRETFDELVAATNALETMVQRSYLDVKTSR
ncbi:hypothetical protein MIB92_18630 [Aestuariirhabdus sp. Z084]|uniref:hypothetical protein n=1 Tax=Aestuariirhabdus haliotis TaxID=2918751 RepID=UPI00201B3C6E|nr:hypothetical protein [Aestuariirhabdus haliotis]MCL6417682.1 hypothetical protein [Aestuariirhabdus haliotis]MCL6421591.1 hypothetical protein [Aestuariirhabdus haliotis]